MARTGTNHTVETDSGGELIYDSTDGGADAGNGVRVLGIDVEGGSADVVEMTVSPPNADGTDWQGIEAGNSAIANAGGNKKFKVRVRTRSGGAATINWGPLVP